MTSSVNNYHFINTHLQAPAARSSLRLQSRSVEVERIKDSSCYDTIIAKYPGIDGASQGIVKILCDDQVDTLDPGQVYLSNVGIDGIGDALQQNSNLKSLKINNIRCSDSGCLIKLGSVLGKALKVNRGLQNLDISFDSTLGIQSFISNLNCFNLRSLIMEGGLLDTTGGEIFSNAFGQKFPLKSFAPSWQVWDANTTASVANGIGKNSCLKTLDFTYFSDPQWLDLDEITTLFKGVGNSKIENFYVPASSDHYLFNDAQKAVILQAVKSNSCFLNYTSMWKTPFPSDLDAAIQNIIKNRTPCLPDPACDIAQTCSAPSPVPPSPFLFSSFDKGLAIGVGSTVATVALVALAVFAVRKCREGSQEERQHLIQ